MTDRIQCFRAGWVLPVAGPPIRRGEVVVAADGRIAAVAPVGAVEMPETARVHELGDAILIPGLVNVHAHPELTMFRGALEDLPFRDWILRLVGAKRAVLTDDDSLQAARWGAVEALAAGITTMAATEASGASALAFTEAGIRGIVYQEVFGPDPRQADDSMRQLRADLDRDLGLAGDLVTVGVSPHAPYTVSDPLYRAVAALARTESLPIAVHIAESAVERELVTRGEGDFATGLRARGIHVEPRGRSPIDLLDRLGLLDLHPLLIHCLDVDDADIAAIASAGAPVAHCPIANAKLGHGLAPIPRMLAAGIRIGIGTDSVASNNRLDLLEEARVAALLQRAASRDHSVLSSGDLLRLCTLDGARALGIDDRIGSLEPGKDADLCAIGIGAPSTVPLADPVSALFHAARGPDVILAVVKGEILYEQGSHRRLDVQSIRRAVDDAAQRLSEAM